MRLGSRPPACRGRRWESRTGRRPVSRADRSRLEAPRWPLRDPQAPSCRGGPRGVPWSKATQQLFPPDCPALPRARSDAAGVQATQGRARSARGPALPLTQRGGQRGELAAVATGPERLHAVTAVRVPRQEVHVQVEDVLPGGPALVPAHVEAPGLEHRLDPLLDHLHGPEQVTHGGVVEVEERRRVKARDDQDVRPRCRKGVEERERSGRLVDDVRGRGVRDDAAEQAGLHRDSFLDTQRSLPYRNPTTFSPSPSQSAMRSTFPATSGHVAPEQASTLRASRLLIRSKFHSNTINFPLPMIAPCLPCRLRSQRGVTTSRSKRSFPRRPSAPTSRTSGTANSSGTSGAKRSRSSISSLRRLFRRARMSLRGPSPSNCTPLPRADRNAPTFAVHLASMTGPPVAPRAGAVASLGPSQGAAASPRPSSPASSRNV